MCGSGPYVPSRTPPFQEIGPISGTDLGNITANSFVMAQVIQYIHKAIQYIQFQGTTYANALLSPNCAVWSPGGFHAF
jgi:hypothetical protein